MAISKTRIHMICGFCGCNDEFEYKVTSEEDDEDLSKDYYDVQIMCNNCSSLTSLDEMIDEKK